MASEQAYSSVNILKHLSPQNTAPALVLPGQILTYADVAARVDQVVARMGRERSLVAMEAQPDADFVTSYLAALKAGHTVARRAAHGA